MNSPGIGLVLGSGSARGWAHAGVILELMENDIPIDYIGGASIGALFAALYACGKIHEIVDFGINLEWDKIARYYLPTMPRGGLIKLSSLEKFIRQFITDIKIENMKIPFLAVATDSLTGEEIEFKTGSLINALKASMAFPGMMEPSWQPPHLLIDGGVVNPIPIANVRKMGAKKIIAVNLNTYKMNQTNLLKKKPSAPMKLFKSQATKLKINNVVNWLRKNYEVDLEESLRFDSKFRKNSPLNIFDVLNNSFYIMQIEISRKSLQIGKPDIVLRPKMQNVRMLDFLKAEKGIEEGRRVTKANMEDIKKLVSI